MTTTADNFCLLWFTCTYITDERETGDDMKIAVTITPVALFTFSFFFCAAVNR